MISFIICSISPKRAEALHNNIEKTIGNIKYEFIAFDNREVKYGITKVYNLGAQKAKYPYLCFLHEDIAFHSRNWGELIVQKLNQPQSGIIGFSGSQIKPNIPCSVHAETNYNLNNYIQSGNGKNRYFFNNLNHNIDYAPCITLDGMCLFVRKNVWEENPFDEQVLKGFHGYDLDFSLQVTLKYQNFICNTIIIEHFSHGSFSTEWVDATLKLYHKWKKNLPLYTGEGSLDIVQKNEEKALFLFLKKAIRTQYPLTKLVPYIQQYWRMTSFRKHSWTLLLKLIGNRILNCKV